MRGALLVFALALFLTGAAANARDLQVAPKDLQVAPKDLQLPPQSLTCERDGQSQWPHTAVEARCLAQIPDIAGRTDHVLTLRLENGTTKSFQDVVSGCNPPKRDDAKCILYRLIAYHPIEQIFIVDVSFYECGYIILFDRRTGHQVKHSAVPRRSPRGQRFVAVDGSKACPHYIDIAIWSAADPTKLEWQYIQPVNGHERWEFVRWDDDNRIVLRVETRVSRSDLATFDAEAILTNKGWQLYKLDRVR